MAVIKTLYVLCCHMNSLLSSILTPATCLWPEHSDDPYSVPINLLGLNYHDLLCLEQCLSYNRCLITFVGWVKENIDRTIYLPDHLSQNISFLLIILIMKSWPKGNVETFLLKVWLWDVEQALEYIQKLPLQLYRREVWPLWLQKRESFPHLHWQDATAFYNIKCKGYRVSSLYPLPPILQVGKLKLMVKEVGQVSRAINEWRSQD